MEHTHEYLHILNSNSKLNIANFTANSASDTSELAFSFNLKNTKYKQYLYLKVDVIKLLGKFDIVESDCSNIISATDSYIKNKFKLSIMDFKLIRFDYRHDAKYYNVNDRNALMKLLQIKSLKTHGYKKREAIGVSSVYFNSKSIKILIYDKEIERYEKGIPPVDDEKSALRFEIAILNKHINYLKRKYNIEPVLENYMKAELFQKYIFEIVKIVKPGDFYKITDARKIIAKSDLSDKNKQLLDDFLVNVSRSSLSEVKNKSIDGTKVYTKYTYDKLLKLLEKLQINPILIPKNWDCSSKIENPFNNLLIK